MKKLPMRTCVATKEKLPKKDLLRIVIHEGNVSIDLTGKANGHGCYLKKDAEVIKMARDKKILDRVLECQIDDSIYEELLSLVD